MRLLSQLLEETELWTRQGRIEKMVGMTVEATGLESKIGDVCQIILERQAKPILAEVVGFRENITIMMPYSDIEGIGQGSSVINTGSKLTIGVGPELVGRTVNALGEPIDGGPEITSHQRYSIQGSSSNPMLRPNIQEPLVMGVKAIDGLLTVGKGQRMGIFAGSGVGKSTLMGVLARNVKADLNVIALVGERGREVMEFINRTLGPQGLAKSILVVATSDQPAMMRTKCALTATTIAEYFRDQGKDVLLVMDSVTRFCMAQREIGLSVGEPPVARGYTPSIYSVLPKLLERTGNFQKGSITGIYTVLVEGDDHNEPIADMVRGILDGHIVLSRKIAMQNHYPAIDVLSSLSRLMNEIAQADHVQAANRLRNLLSVYQANQDLISIGAYKQGANPILDQAMGVIKAIQQFLTQDVDEAFEFQETLDLLNEALN